MDYLKGPKTSPGLRRTGTSTCTPKEASLSQTRWISRRGRSSPEKAESRRRGSSMWSRRRWKTPPPDAAELERLNGFPDDWTNIGMSDGRRAFMMGNALVVGLVRMIGGELTR